MVTQSGIIKLEEYIAPLGGKSYDSIHLAAAFKDDKPYRFGVMVAKLFSSSNRFSNKTLSALTLGNGNFEAIDNNVYRWTVAGDDEINFYVKKHKPLDKAGAYGIQDDFGCLFIEKIKGDYYNIMGLPLVKLYETIQKVL